MKKSLAAGSALTCALDNDMTLRLAVTEDGRVIVQKYKELITRDSSGNIIDIKYDIFDEKKIY